MGAVEYLADRKRARARLGRVLVLGLGVSGKAAAEYCLDLLGDRVDALAVAAGAPNDDSLAWAEAARAAGAVVLFDHEDIEGAYDLCIASPGISEFSDFYRSAAVAAAEVISEVEFAWRESRANARWVAITGTNGKTTTTALTCHLLRAGGMSASAVGNIGETCIEAVAAGATAVYVAEVSSYQLASTRDFAPDVAVVLNITPDHLAWHRTHENYAAAKWKVLAQASAATTAVLNAGDDDNNDNDWGEATGQVIGEGRQGITPSMCVLGNFRVVRSEPNAYGQKFNLLSPYNWTPEVNRSVDLGMTGAGGWRTLIFTTPWGTKVFYVKLPQTGDELMPLMFGAALLGAMALLLAVIARRKKKEDEEEEEE